MPAIARTLQLDEAADERFALPAWGSPPEEPLSDLEDPPAVLIVDGVDINRCLLRGILRPEGYRVLEAATPAEALVLLEREKVDLVVLELMMPGMSGPDLCRRVKQQRGSRFTPVLILTSLQGKENEIAGMDSGADEFLVKPLHPDVVRARVKAMLRHKEAVDSLEQAEGVLLALARAIEHRDEMTIGHCERLASLSVKLGLALGLPRSQMLALHRGGYLHDIGKVAIPDGILFKPGPLTPDERRVMETHVIRGEEICRSVRTLAPVLPIIRSHHERWDGSGYPDGLKGEETPLLARILQVADIYDALTSERPYKEAMSPGDALTVLDQEAAKGWRDPELVRLLRKVCEIPAAETADEVSMRRSIEALRKALLK